MSNGNPIKNKLFSSTNPAVDRRIIPQVIDCLAEESPETVFASVTRSADIKDGFREITYKKYADTINHAARWLEEHVGVGERGHTIAYIGPSDLRYVILTIAAVKIGCTMLFLSPRNTLQGQLHLLEHTKCGFFATPATLPPGVSAIFQSRKLQQLIVPELEEWLDMAPGESLPYKRDFEEIRHEPIAVLHSSGTTSLPKPVPYTHGACASVWWQLEHGALPSESSTLLQFAASAERLFMAFPMFHAGGLFFPLALAVFARVEIVYPPPGLPMNGGIADAMHRLREMDAACLPPSIIEEMAKSSSYLEGMSGLRYVITGGAPLPKALGDKVQEYGPQICNMLASTETAIIPSMRVEREEWQYIHVAPGYGVVFRTDDHETYELFIERTDGSDCRQAVFENYPELHEYSTSDLFRRHPDPKKPNHWISCGRHDDVIVLLNGEKFNPTAMEKKLQGHPEIVSALMFGRDRLQTSLLVEPADHSIYDSEESQRSFLRRVWKAVEAANRLLPAHARLSEDLVCLTSKSKPMQRTPKGSVMRNITYKDFEEEMNELYEAHMSIKPRSRPTTPGGSDPLAVPSLTRTICQVASWLTIESTQNLFAAGLDSLHVLQIVRRINNDLGTSLVNPGMVYANPTVEELAKVLHAAFTGDSKPKTNRDSKIDLLLDSLSQNLPSANDTLHKIALLTGSNGSFGPHMLRALCSHFDKIYCLVRKLPTTQQESKIVYLTYTLANSLLGLSFESYSSLLGEVTHVVHNAWLVDFNLSLESFSDHLFGVRHLIDFACRAKHKPRIFFISSIGAVINSYTSSVPEEVYFDSSVCQNSGYGESKHIAEVLLHRAGVASGVKSTILRLGQIAGPVHSAGLWSSRDWLPGLLFSSTKCLKQLPDSLGAADRIDWIPADILANIVCELMDVDNDNKTPVSPYLRPITEVFHVVNPSPTSWKALLPVVQAKTGCHDIVPLKSWVEALEASAAGLAPNSAEAAAEMKANNPAVKLATFFRGLAESTDALPRLDVTKALERSATLRSLGPVEGAWMEKWLEGWGFLNNGTDKETLHTIEQQVQQHKRPQNSTTAVMTNGDHDHEHHQHPQHEEIPSSPPSMSDSISDQHAEPHTPSSNSSPLPSVKGDSDMDTDLSDTSVSAAAAAAAAKPSPESATSLLSKTIQSSAPPNPLLLSPSPPPCVATANANAPATSTAATETETKTEPASTTTDPGGPGKGNFGYTLQTNSDNIEGPSKLPPVSSALSSPRAEDFGIAFNAGLNKERD